MQIRCLVLLVVFLGCWDSENSIQKPVTKTLETSVSKSAPVHRLKVKPLELDTTLSRAKLAPQTKPDLRPLASYTSADFTSVVIAVSNCSALSEVELKRCSYYLKVLELLAHKNAPTGHRRFLMSSVGNRLLDHETASVRWLAARLLKSIAQVERSSRLNLVERLKLEQTPLVITTLMKSLGHFIAEDQTLKRTFVKLADHQSPEIRGLAVSRLSQLDLSDEKALRTLLEQKLATDPSAAVGKAVCLQLGQRPTEDGLAKMAVIIRDQNHVANEVCLVALTSTWIAPSLSKLSQTGFRMTLDIIKERLATKAKLSWSVMARIAQGSHLVPKKHLTEVQLGQLNELLTTFVYAPEQNIQARVLAIQALNTFHASPEVFKGIIARYQMSDTVDYQLAARAKAYQRGASSTP